MGESMVLKEGGVLKGHSGRINCVATTQEASNMLLTGGRDKKVVIWNLSREDPTQYGFPYKSLEGHAHFVEDIVISSDGQFALSSSWDTTLRLWDLVNARTTRRFLGHTKDVLSVAFSADNRQIVSGSRDKTIKLWNTLGECKYTIDEQQADAHTDWVSCVRFSPNTQIPIIVSAGWDRMVKVWNLSDCRLRNNLKGHTGYINTVAVSPDGSLCASGGKDTTAMLWDLNEGKHLYSLDGEDIINALAFSPTRYWLCAGTDSGIIIWDLESKRQVTKLGSDYPDFRPMQGKNCACTSLAWSADGSTLFGGYSDGMVRVWSIASAQHEPEEY